MPSKDTAKLLRIQSYKSKGILFHYFGSKKKLGIYIVNYVIDYMKEKFYKDNIKVPDDIFERIMHRSMGKLQMAYEEPQMYKILYDIYINPQVCSHVQGNVAGAGA